MNQKNAIDEIKRKANALILQKGLKPDDVYFQDLEDFVRSIPGYELNKKDATSDNLPHFDFPIIQDTDTALLECEVRLQETLEQVSVGISHIALDGTFLNVNSRFCELTGYTEEELLNMTFQQITYLEDVNFNLQLLEKFKQNELNQTSIQKRYIHKSGNLMWVRLNAALIKNKFDKPNYIISIIEDISKQKKAEEIVKRHRNIFQFADWGIAVLEPDFSEYTMENEVFSAIYKEINKLTLGKFILNLNNESNKYKLQPLVEKARKKGNHVFEQQYNIKNDLCVSCFINIIIIKDKTGIEEAIAINIQVICNNENDKNIIEETNGKKDNTTQTLITQLSIQPLNSILGFAELLKLSNDDECKSNYIDALINSSHELLSSVNSVYDNLLIETELLKLEPKPFSINLLLFELYNYFNIKRKQLGINIFIKKALTNGQSKVMADMRAIKQILIKLVENAIKYGNGKDIEFGYELERTNGNPKIRFFVNDNGVGLTNDEIAYLLSTNNYNNSGQKQKVEIDKNQGLGLIIAKSYAGLLGSNIQVKSEPGKGSEFWFGVHFAPVSEDAKEIYNAAKETFENQEWYDKQIMIVNTESDIFEKIKNTLAHTKAGILYAENSSQALKLFKQDKNINLVILDIDFLQIKGISLLQDIKKINNSTKVVALSVDAKLNSPDELTRFGFDGLLTEINKKNEVLTFFSKHL